MADSKMNIFDFGAGLLSTGDLDPVYIMVYHAGLDRADLRRWLLAYFCFYHCGTACKITDRQRYGITIHSTPTINELFWEMMKRAAGSKDYPRSSERRHFRGQAALKSVEYLKGRGVADLFAPLEGGPYTVQQIMASVQEWKGFGPWISFKVADMVERLGLAQVSFGLDAVMYDSPAEAARMWWTWGGGGQAQPGEAERWAIGQLTKQFKHVMAPPRYDRPVNEQEAETILCKWKSYMSGHYYVGKDIHEIREGLLRFSRCALSQKMLAAGRLGKLWT